MIVSVFFIIGLILLCLGLILSYVFFRIFQMLETSPKEKKTYILTNICSVFLSILSAGIFNHFITMGSLLGRTLI